jgi:hypothetical protein
MLFAPLPLDMYPQWPIEKLRYLAAGFSAERLIEPELSGWPEHAEADRLPFEEVLRSLSKARGTDMRDRPGTGEPLRLARAVIDRWNDAIPPN